MRACMSRHNYHMRTQAQGAKDRHLAYMLCHIIMHAMSHHHTNYHMRTQAQGAKDRHLALALAGALLLGCLALGGLGGFLVSLRAPYISFPTCMHAPRVKRSDAQLQSDAQSLCNVVCKPQSACAHAHRQGPRTARTLALGRTHAHTWHPPTCRRLRGPPLRGKELVRRGEKSSAPSSTFPCPSLPFWPPSSEAHLHHRCRRRRHISFRPARARCVHVRGGEMHAYRIPRSIILITS